MIQARPTVYRGIRMRSRLEADFARWLDDAVAYGGWAYEPNCFAGTDGQYLPDFRVGEQPSAIYLEVKPHSIREDRIDPVLARMEIIWESEPDAALGLWLWKYQDWGSPVRLVTDEDRRWNLWGCGRPTLWGTP